MESLATQASRAVGVYQGVTGVMAPEESLEIPASG